MGKELKRKKNTLSFHQTQVTHGNLAVSQGIRLYGTNRSDGSRQGKRKTIKVFLTNRVRSLVPTELEI